MAESKKSTVENENGSEKGFMEDDEEVLTEEEEKDLKEKLKYYGYM